ncbi:hypothetical protein ONZ45_g6889 [Pleurotus djamor]|nr:hypothetical protein ONZ45_g6889 [Pleurotus djamor]
MDADPWANAWGGPPSSKPADPWASSTHSSVVHHEQEADIGQTPSWNTVTDNGPTLYSSPTWTAGADDAPMWSSDANTGWEPPPYDIPLGRTPTTTSEVDSESDTTIDPVDETAIVARPVPDEAVTPPSFHNSPIEPDAADDDGDGFGTFESAEDTHSEADDPWTPAGPTFTSDADPVGWSVPSWQDKGNASDPDESGDVEVDEWENAKRIKEIRDRQVPPELLASIMQQINQLERDLWPLRTEEPSGESPKTDIPLCSLSNLPDMLEPATTRLMPILTLPPLLPLSETFAHKNAASALKLTRNLFISQQSPMAFLLASKGRGDWEASLRSQLSTPLPIANAPQKNEGEFAAAGLGWRVLGAEEREDLEEAWAKEHSSKVGVRGKKPGGGGWFWNRRASTNPVPKSPTAANANTEAKPPSTSEPSVVSSSPRASVDSSRSSQKPSTNGTVTTPTTSTLPTPSGSRPSTPVSLASPALPTPPALGESHKPASTSIEADDPEPSASPSTSTSTTPTPAPSAVSRFFGRFSRAKSSQPQDVQESRKSVTLSSNDIQFLDDIPTVSSDDSVGRNTFESDRSLLGGTSLDEEQIKKVLIKQRKLPPPLAPPPSAPPRPVRPAVTKVDPSPAVDDMSLFNSLPPIQHTATSSSDFDFGIFEVTPQPLSGQTEISPRLPPKDYPPPLSSSILPTSKSVVGNSNASSQSQPKRKPTAVMSKTKPPTNGSANLFSLPPPPSLAKPLDPFFPTPTSSRPISPKPPSETIPPPIPLPSDFDDDDFADFASAPSTTSQSFTSPALVPSTYDSVVPSSNSNQAFFPSQSSASNVGSLDDFDDFVSSPVISRTSSPPVPAYKSSPLLANTSQPSSRFASPQINPISPIPSSPLNPYVGTSSQLQSVVTRTSSLVEEAATHTGVWPAPRSPAPPSLPPPPQGLSFGANISDSQTSVPRVTPSIIALSSNLRRTTSPSASGASTPISLNQDSIVDLFGAPMNPVLPLGQSQTSNSKPSLLDTSFDSLTSPLASSGSKQPASGKPLLSAQDLSFFEGL